MTGLIAARQEIVKFVKRYEIVIIFCVKILAGFLIFRLINSAGLYDKRFEALFRPPFDFPYIALSALLFACLPPTLGNALIAAEAIIQISSSLEAAVFAAIVCVCILVFYARLAPRNGFLIIAMCIGFYLRVPYVVVIFAGLYMGIGAIPAVAIGCFVYQSAPTFITLAREFKTPETIDVTTLPQSFMDVYKTLYYSFSSRGNLGWVYLGFAFAMVIIVVRVISMLDVNRSRDVAVLVGGAACVIFGFIGVVMKTVGVGALELLVCSALSVIIVEAMRLFESALDYRRAERVRFEDDDNYYYVKVIPKVIVSKRADKQTETAAKKTRATKKK